VQLLDFGLQFEVQALQVDEAYDEEVVLGSELLLEGLHALQDLPLLGETGFF